MLGIIIAVVVTLVIAVPVSIFVTNSYHKKVTEQKVGGAEQQARAIIDEAVKTAETKKREILIEAKEESMRSKNELEKEIKERRAEVSKSESRVQQKEENLDKKLESADRKEQSLVSREENLEKERQKVAKLSEQRVQELERISGLTSQQAKDFLLNTVKDDVKADTAKYVKESMAQAKDEADKQAKEILVTAIQRCAADHVAESTISVVQLPNDEMKGRIIGREGRNIRTLETLTGVELIIDDTPEAVVLSAFDPVRREVARIALEKLIVDGRIHPARIEEMVEKAKKEVDNTIREEGEQAALDTGVHGLNPEEIKLLGRLKYRTSFGQNVLKHSIEVSQLAGLLAAEVGVDTRLAKRAGLLHDIGKAVDHEQDQSESQSHVALGVEICRKYKESPVIINAVAAHHGDCEPESLIALLIQAADTISAARPGARRETLENYTNRIQQLEDVADSFEGVERSFAIQAGREVRVMVVPEKISDADMVLLARDITKKIENELQYPGQIKVNVIRESRVVDYAK
ncbi:MAG: ribonuclease Y [Candidatus Weimeria sp.]